jgi:hypothetical protein
MAGTQQLSSPDQERAAALDHGRTASRKLELVDDDGRVIARVDARGFPRTTRTITALRQLVENERIK